MCFFLKILWFFWTLPVLMQRLCSTCLVCVHTLTPRENIERPESGIFSILRKRTPCISRNTGISEYIFLKQPSFFKTGVLGPEWGKCHTSTHLLRLVRFCGSINRECVNRTRSVCLAVIIYHVILNQKCIVKHVISMHVYV